MFDCRQDILRSLPRSIPRRNLYNRVTVSFYSQIKVSFNFSSILLSSILRNSTSSQRNPIMGFVQPGVEWRPIEKTALKADVNYYEAWNVKGNPLLTGGSATAGNTLIGGAYRYNYNIVNPTLQLELDDPLKRAGINMPRPFCELKNF